MWWKRWEGTCGSRLTVEAKVEWCKVIDIDWKRQKQMLVVESSWYLYALGEHLFCDKGSGLRPAMVNSEVHVGELQLLVKLCRYACFKAPCNNWSSLKLLDAGCAWVWMLLKTIGSFHSISIKVLVTLCRFSISIADRLGLMVPQDIQWH